jgi:hypothetical protein
VPRKTHKVHILVRNAAKETMNVLDRQVLILTTRVSQVEILIKHGHNARNTLTLVLVWLYRATPVLCFLAAALNIGTGCQHISPSRLSTPSKRCASQRLVDLEFAASNTYTSQRIHDPRKKLDKEDGLCQAIVAKVSGASVVCLTTRTTDLSIF